VDVGSTLERGGELLAAVKAASGRQAEKGDTPPRFTRKQMANGAGLSPDQAKTMLRIFQPHPAPGFDLDPHRTRVISLLRPQTGLAKP